MVKRMSKVFKDIAREQYTNIVNAAAPIRVIRQPKEGWIKAVRMALGMSGAQLSRRLGNTRTIASYLERSELDGKITLRKMQDTAEALGCRFIYAIVPEASIAEIIEKQAALKAQEIVSRTSTHMMLEAQQLDQKQLQNEVVRLKAQMINELNRDFWND